MIPHPSELKDIYERNRIKGDLIDKDQKVLVIKMKEAAKVGDSGVTFTFGKDYNEPTKQAFLNGFLGMGYKVEGRKLSEEEADAGYSKVRISWGE